jgi:hypothetical protein
VSLPTAWLNTVKATHSFWFRSQCWMGHCVRTFLPCSWARICVSTFIEIVEGRKLMNKDRQKKAELKTKDCSLHGVNFFAILFVFKVHHNNIFCKCLLQRSNNFSFHSLRSQISFSNISQCTFKKSKTKTVSMRNACSRSGLHSSDVWITCLQLLALF